MARIFPPEITAADVATMLAALDGKTPYTDDGWVTACFDFGAPDVSVRVVLPNREYDAAARRAVEEAIALLPRFHARVAAAHGPDKLDDDLYLSLMDIDGDEVNLLYCFNAINATPDFQFSKACHGGPLRPVAFDPTWRTDTVLALGRQMHESREFGAMPILADALQDAGCEDEELLSHCRGPGPHVRGCWVLDLVLGKE